MHTKTVLAIALAAGLGLSALAALQPEKKPEQPATKPESKPDARPESKPDAKPDIKAEQPSLPPAPEPAKPRPVPNGPVVQKSEIEGILIEDLKIGTGYEVKPNGAVVAYYHGTLKEGGNGKAFDSAFERGEPMAFPLKGVVQGWQKGVPGMKVGGVRRLTIPSKFGYGPQGSGDRIPPNADLVFVIELVDALAVTDAKPGTGEEVAGLCVAVLNQTVKSKDAKEPEKAESARHPAIWIPGDSFSAAFQLDWVQDALAGMKVGSTFKLHLPKEMNTPQPGLEVGHPTNVALDMDAELLSVRNLQRKAR